MIVSYFSLLLVSETSKRKWRALPEHPQFKCICNFCIFFSSSKKFIVNYSQCTIYIYFYFIYLFMLFLLVNHHSSMEGSFLATGECYSTTWLMVLLWFIFSWYIKYLNRQIAQTDNKTIDTNHLILIALNISKNCYVTPKRLAIRLGIVYYLWMPHHHLYLFLLLHEWISSTWNTF